MEFFYCLLLLFSQILLVPTPHKLLDLHFNTPNNQDLDSDHYYWPITHDRYPNFNNIQVNTYVIKTFNSKYANFSQTSRLLICMMIIQSGDIQTNPGPRQVKYPCGLCNRAVRYGQRGVMCDGCDTWFHCNCMHMNTAVYRGITSNVSWLCCNCGIPNFSSSFFSATFSFDSPNPFSPLAEAIPENTPPRLASSPKPPNTEASSPKPPNTQRKPLPTPKTSTGSSISSIPISPPVEHTSPINHVSYGSSLTRSDTGTPLPLDLSTPSRLNIPPSLEKSERASQTERKQCIRIAIINFRSIVNKIIDTHTLLETQDIDILIGTETHLDSTINTSEIFPSKFTVYRKDRNRQGGGVCIAINNTIPSMQLQTQQPATEQVWAQVQTEGNKRINVGSFYRPPGSDESALQSLDATLEELRQGCSQTLIGGDFNLWDINWNSCSTPPGSHNRTQCQQLIEIANNNCLEQIIDVPTRGDNTLDLCFTSNPSLVHRSYTGPPVCCDRTEKASDHDVVYVETLWKAPLNKKNKREIPKYKDADWEALKSTITDGSNSFFQEQPSTRSLDINWNHFKEIVKGAIKQHIPTKISSTRHQLPWLNT